MLVLHFNSSKEKPSQALKKITLPGSKYVANRVLFLAVLAKGESVIKNVPFNQDIERVIEELSFLGAKIIRKKNTLQIRGNGGNLELSKRSFYTHDNGTFSRFLIPLLALTGKRLKITGSPQMNRRPMEDLLNALADLAVEVKSSSGKLPVSIKGPLQPKKISILGKISSQYISALLMALPLAKGDSEIKLKGELVSFPFVKLTLDLMKQFGVKVNFDIEKKVFKIKGQQQYLAKNYSIEVDPVSASYFLSLAVMLKKNFTLDGYHYGSLQGEARYLDELKKIKYPLIIKKKKRQVSIWGEKFKKPLPQKYIFDMKDKPDIVPTFCSLAATRVGDQFIFKNIAHLRYKESNRVENIVRELKKCNVKIKATPTQIELKGSSDLLPNFLDSHHDHRMAMSLSLLSGVTDFLVIKNEEAVNKSFPDFYKTLVFWGFKITSFKKKVSNLVFIGYRGSGKTTLAKKLATFTGLGYLSSDEIFEKEYGLISDFVKKNGWGKFRLKENQVIKKIISKKNTLIDCGGGVVENKANLSLLKNSLVLYFEVPEEVLIERLEKSYSRPSLLEKKEPALRTKKLTQETRLILKKRLPLYNEWCDFRIKNLKFNRTLKILLIIYNNVFKNKKE